MAVAAAVRVASIRGAVAAVGFAPTRRLGYAKAPVLAVVGIRPAENGCVYSPTRTVSGCGAAIGLAVPRVACCRRTDKWKRAFIREVRFSFRGNGFRDTTILSGLPFNAFGFPKIKKIVYHPSRERRGNLLARHWLS